jgi:CRISPR/Cas system-associated endonuclease Cas1
MAVIIGCISFHGREELQELNVINAAISLHNYLSVTEYETIAWGAS